MKKRKWKHKGVLPNGTFIEKGGQVRVDGGITESQPSGGCDLDGCNCSEGHWICVAYPRTNEGIVQGYTLHFENAKEMNQYKLSKEYLQIKEKFNN